MGKQNPLSITQPGPSRRRYLFTSLATGSLAEDGLPLNVGLVIGVDGGREVKSVLQDLAGAGVDHGPLDSSVSQRELLFRMRHLANQQSSNWGLPE